MSVRILHSACPIEMLGGALWTFLASIMLTSAATAQCDLGWKPGPLPESIAGANGPVYAAITWDPPGIEPELLVIGGDFTQVGGVSAHRIAAWDGQKWRAFGEGFNDAVFALTVWNNSLVAGGTFETPVGRLGLWTGSAWTSLGGIGPTYPTDDSVNALAVYNNELYVGGVFCCVNGQPYSNGAIYNGTTWRNGPGMGESVYAFQVFDDDGAGPNPAHLYVGGDSGTTFGNLYRWHGAGTVATPSPNGPVYALTVVNAIGAMPGGLIVGGSFTLIPNPGGGNYSVQNIARYDGNAWSFLGDGIGMPLVQDHVSALRAFGTHLYAGGNFVSAHGGTVNVRNLAKWNGSQWSAVGGIVPGGGMAGAVRELRVHNGELIAVGQFTSADGVAASNLARWSGLAFSAIKPLQQVFAIWPYGTSVAIGGLFNHHNGESDLSNTSNIVVWNGAETRRLGSGVNGRVNALTWYSTGGPLAANILVAGGDFTVADGGINGLINVNRIASWAEDGQTPSAWAPMGSGFNGTVNALARFNGWTVAGGSFTASGATPVSRLAKYTGSPASWQPLTSPDPALNGSVFALKAFTDNFGGTDSYLVIGGDFTSAPPTGVAANRILLRRESSLVGQSAYQALGQGFNGPVYAIERYGSGLNARTYAAGTFTQSGSIVLNRIARLNGANWEPVGTGVGFNNAVYALRVSGADLYAAGIFTTVDGISVNGLAKWNGSAWSAVDGGVNGSAFALWSHQSELLVGGSFTAAELGAVTTHGLARFQRTGLPWFVQQPASSTVNCGTYASFSVRPPEGYAGTFQWRRGGVPLVDGPGPGGGYISNTSGPFSTDAVISLGIGPAHPNDAGTYDCVLTTACGSVTSSAATLAVNACVTCAADIAPPPPNGNGVVNVDDLLAVINAWGACANPNICPADIVPPGGNDLVNVDDLLAIINGWGACP